MRSNTIYTIGYGNRPIEDFIGLVQRYDISAVGDVRSRPYSARYQNYSRGPLRESLRAHDIRYVFLGKELGARPSDPGLYQAGRASYAAIAASEAFLQGIERVKKGLAEFSIALMCAEKDPLDCHRAVLIAPRLIAAGLSVRHIGSSGLLETQSELEGRLLRKVGLHQGALFGVQDDSKMLDDAYRRRGDELAYDIDAAYKARQPR